MPSPPTAFLSASRMNWLVFDLLAPLAISRLALVLVGWLAMMMLANFPNKGA